MVICGQNFNLFAIPVENSTRILLKVRIVTIQYGCQASKTLQVVGVNYLFGSLVVIIPLSR